MVQDAEILARLMKGVDSFLQRAKVKRPTQGQRRQIAALVEGTAARMKIVSFRKRAEALVSRLNNLPKTRR